MIYICPGCLEEFVPEQLTQEDYLPDWQGDEEWPNCPVCGYELIQTKEEE